MPHLPCRCAGSAPSLAQWRAWWALWHTGHSRWACPAVMRAVCINDVDAVPSACGAPCAVLCCSQTPPPNQLLPPDPVPDAHGVLCLPRPAAGLEAARPGGCEHCYGTHLSGCGYRVLPWHDHWLGVLLSGMSGRAAVLFAINLQPDTPPACTPCCPSAWHAVQHAFCGLSKPPTQVCRLCFFTHRHALKPCGNMFFSLSTASQGFYTADIPFLLILADGAWAWARYSTIQLSSWLRRAPPSSGGGSARLTE